MEVKTIEVINANNVRYPQRSRQTRPLSSFVRCARKIHFTSAANAPSPSDFVCHLSRSRESLPQRGKQEYVIKKRQDGENKKTRSQVKFEKTENMTPQRKYNENAGGRNETPTARRLMPAFDYLSPTTPSISRLNGFLPSIVSFKVSFSRLLSRRFS